MQIQTVVMLDEDDSFAYTPDAAAAQVLAALGGNPTKDYATCTIQMSPNKGEAGTTPPWPPPVEA
jgi:hypothetical protein